LLLKNVHTYLSTFLLVEFEIPTAVLLKIQVFWDVTHGSWQMVNGISLYHYYLSGNTV